MINSIHNNENVYKFFNECLALFNVTFPLLSNLMYISAIYNSKKKKLYNQLMN